MKILFESFLFVCFESAMEFNCFGFQTLSPMLFIIRFNPISTGLFYHVVALKVGGLIDYIMFYKLC